MANEHRVIQRNSECVAVTNFEPMVEGHSMVLPVRHVQDLGGLTEKEAKSIFELIQSTSVLLTRTYEKDCIIFYNQGRHASQPHLHFHVIPADEMLRDTFAKAYGTSPRKRISDEELFQTRKRILDANNQ